MLAGQCDDCPGHCVFIVPLGGLVALCAAGLIHQLARLTLTRSALLGMLHSDPTTLRA